MTDALARPRAAAKLLGEYATPTGLDLPGGETLPFSLMERLGTVLGVYGRNWSWCIADWGIYCEDHYGERMGQLMEATGLQFESLANLISLGRKFPRRRRRLALSPAHHADVASLETADQERWLDEAEKNEWTRAQFRAALGKGKKVLTGPCDHHVCRSCGKKWEG